MFVLKFVHEKKRPPLKNHLSLSILFRLVGLWLTVKFFFYPCFKVKRRQTKTRKGTEGVAILGREENHPGH